MQQPPILSPLVNLEQAIDRRPLTVSPDTSVLEVIEMMGRAKSSCVLPSLKLSLHTVLMSEVRASSVLVVQSARPIGIFTDQKALQIIAAGRNLAKLAIRDVMEPLAIVLQPSDPQDVFTALSLLRQHQIKHLPVVDEQQHLVGMVTFESIRQSLQLDELLKTQPLSTIANASALRVSGAISILALAQLMAEQQSHWAVITQHAEFALSATPNTKNAQLNLRNSVPQPFGILSVRDIVQLQSLNLDLANIQAQAVMTPFLLCLSASESILLGHWEMQQQSIQQLGVWSTDAVEPGSGELLGIVTPVSFLQTLDLTEMSQTMERLQQSITQFATEQQQPQPSAISLQFQAEPSPEKLIEQLERNRLLATIALRIRESLNLNEILNTAVNEVRQFLETDRVIIYRFNPDLSGTVVVEAIAPGWEPALGKTITDNCFGKDYAPAYKEGRIQVTEDIYTAGLTQCHIDILVLFDIRANLVVPIIQGDHLWGLLCAYHCSGPRRWRDFEVDLLKQLATHIAIAIQQSELYEQLQAELAERKRAEEQIKASLKEKEVLLKEIHHRVKNNLQIISSLLKLQSNYIADQQALAMFKDSQNRIRSMALIHEKLYQSKDLSRINFTEYVQDLTNTLLRSYSASSQSVALNVNTNHIWLSIDTAIPCGLIINELISNSLKHAFSSEVQDPTIGVDIYADDNSQFVLTISDNGIGFPENLDFRNTESLGLELVCTLTEQLEGTIELDRNSGTNFKIKFKEIGHPGRV